MCFCSVNKAVQSSEGNRGLVAINIATRLELPFKQAVLIDMLHR